MEERKKRRRNRLQNLTIALLTASALLLLLQMWLPSGAGSGGFSGLLPTAGPEAGSTAELATLPTPVRLAFTGTYGRFGNLFAVTTDESFAEPGDLLREALGSAGTPQPCQEADFRAALAGESVYYDFQTVLPLSVIAGLVGGDAPAEFSARLLLLASQGDASVLYFSDGDAFYRCATKAAAADLRKLANDYQISGVAFAYELDEDAAPYTLFLTGEIPACPILAAQNPVGDVDGLLTALGFNPGTRDRYTESTGTLVVREGDRTLRVQPDGTAVYDSGSTTDLRIAAGETPDLEDAVMGSFQFFSRILSGSGASLCLQSAGQQDNVRVLTFDYQYNGVTIRRSSGVPAVTVRLEDGNIAWFSCYLRTYAAGEEKSRLLPLSQALAIAREYPGKEIIIGYTDGGAPSISAGWLAE